jgi:beta-galactosidase
VLDRRLKQDSLHLSNAKKGDVLDILLENNGRINYGPFLIDNRQGITESVTVNSKQLLGWKMYKFPFNTLSGFKYSTNKDSHELEPALYKGTFILSMLGDTYLDMHSYGKGFVFLNGHNLGKYWNIGPQQTIYIPASWLKKGANEIVVFDELKAMHTKISALDHPILNEVVKD